MLRLKPRRSILITRRPIPDVRVVVAGPASLTGRYPVGTGRSNVPATRTMPIPDDLAALLAS